MPKNWMPPTNGQVTPKTQATSYNGMQALAESVGVPFPAKPTPLDQMLREYVAGGGFPWYGNTARTLPWAIDDVSGDFGDDIYDRMMVDPQVAACVNVFKAKVLSEDLQIRPAIDDHDSPDYDTCKRMVEEAERMLDDMETSLEDVMWNMLDALPYGNKVAEQICQYDRGFKEDRPLLQLQQIKVKPRRATAFVVDAYFNIVGLLAQIPGSAAPWQGTLLFTPDATNEIPNFIGRDKFAIFTHRIKDGDPRGTSLIRPAYDAWWRKRQIIPEYLKYLAQFAGPSIIGFTPEGATPVEQTDTNGNSYTVSAEQIMLAALQQFHNGYAASFPGGSTVKEIAMQGDGRAFLSALQECDQQMTKAILTQELATEQSRNQARAAAQVHQDVLGVIILHNKKSSGKMVRKQILRPWVERNWGVRARHLTPQTSYGEIERQDQAQIWVAASQLANSGYFVDDQLQEMDRIIGVPVRQVAQLGVPPSQRGAQGAGKPNPQPNQQPQPDDGRVVVKSHTRAPRGSSAKQDQKDNNNE